VGRDLAADSDINLWAMWRHFGRRAGNVEEDDDIVIVTTGSPLATFNPAFVRRVPPDAKSLVRRAIDREDPVVITVNPAVEGVDRLVAAALSTGLVANGRLPGMVLTDLQERGTAPPGLDVRLGADDAATWERYFDVLCASFDVPPEAVARLLDPSIYRIATIAAIVGAVDGQIVTTSMAFLTGDVVGVYNVATLPDWRGKGFGRAMTWAAVVWGRERGARVAVLQASEMGYPVYERMGFREVVPYVQLVAPA
jgi:N-acetylglutamate synthase